MKPETHSIGKDGTVGKALDILDIIAGFGRPVRYSEVLENCSYPKATLYRFMQTLTNRKMLRYDSERQTYALGLHLVRLAHSAWRDSSLAPIARPHLDALSRATGMTIHLAQLEDGQVIYVDKRNARDPVEMYSGTGKIAPAYCTGIGKAMVAFLGQSQQANVIEKQSFYRYTPSTLCDDARFRDVLNTIRADGIAFDREEHEPGIICVAVPILSAGRVAGGLSITATTQQTTLDELQKFGDDLKATATKIGVDAEIWNFPIGNDTTRGK